MYDKNVITAKKEKKLAELKEQLAKVDESYARALQAQSWRSSDGMSERSLTNANVAEIYKEKCDLEKRIEKLESELDGTSCHIVRIGVLR